MNLTEKELEALRDQESRKAELKAEIETLKAQINN
jgi:hypothetical protein